MNVARRSPRQSADTDALPAQALDVLGEAMASFRRDGRATDVSFRQLLPGLRYGERGTHFLHPYPGKLIAHIPYFFLRVPEFSRPGCRVLDPFCGSGTTLVEAQIRGVDAHGLDVNPFAVLLSLAKCDPAPVNEVVETAKEVVSAAATASTGDHGIPNGDYWYTPNVLSALSSLRTAISGVEDVRTRRAMLVALASTARTLSLADPRLPVPVRVQPEKARTTALRARFEAVELRARTGIASETFLATASQLAARYERLADLVPTPAPKLTCEVASILDPRPLPADARFDLVITSPPYCGAQKYVRSTGHAIAWTGDIGPGSLADLEAQTIGREHIRARREILDQLADPAAVQVVERIAAVNEMRGAIAASYLKEMSSAFRTIASAVTSGGHVVLVIGDNVVAGEPFPATSLLTADFARHGFEPLVILRDAIPSRGLMTKRNKHGGPIGHEQVVVLRRAVEAAVHA